MSKITDHEKLESQLDDLATGQLGPLAAMRLRRQIARDPQLALAWNEVRELRAGLAGLSPERSANYVPAGRAKTFTFGGLTMKRRTAALAAGGLMLLSVSGALAERYLMPRDAEWGCPGPDRDTDWWNFHGQFRGHAELLTPEGKSLNDEPMQGTSLQGAVHVSLFQKHRETLHCTVSGVGKHALIDAHGKTMGYLVLSDITKKDIKDISDDDARSDRAFDEFYRLPERVTPSGEGRGYAPVVSYTDVVADTVIEFVSAQGLSCGNEHPISWKTYGDVHVRSQYFATAETFPLISQNPAKQHLTVRLPKRTIIDEGQSDVYPTPQDRAKMSPADRRDSLRSFPSPHLTPVTYWTIAKPGTDVNMEAGKGTGKWEHVLETGKLMGYGHFRVRNHAGKTVLILDITRPKRHPNLTTGEENDIDIPQRVVPGWDGEE